MSTAFLKLIPLGLALLAGCSVPSIQGLYDDPREDGVIVEGLEGLWRFEDDDSERVIYLEIDRAEDEPAYHAVLWETPELSTEFDAVAVRVGERIYMDTIPDFDFELEDGAGRYLQGLHVIVGHLFWRIEVRGDELEVAYIYTEALVDELRQQEPGALAVTPALTTERIAISAPPAEIREFLRRNDGREDFLFEDPGLLKRADEKVWSDEFLKKVREAGD